MHILAALLIDALVGDPEPLWRRVPHPVVLMGRLVTTLDRMMNTGSGRRAKGVIALLIFLCTGAATGIALAALPVVGWYVEIIAAGILLAQRSLIEHLRAVVRGLEAGIDTARHAVSKIVGRDPERLDEAGVARAAIESGAENFSDGVVAPVFWFSIAGLPGILVYKFVNTADSMIGHRTDRHAEFGWASAKFDDVLNYVPARLCGALFCLVSGSRNSFSVMWRDARLHNSPNAGWPEAALAATLGVAIAGPRIYAGKVTDTPYMNAEGRKEATAQDLETGISVIWRAWGWLVSAALVYAVLQFT